jgi:hypothetical protein
MFSSVALLVDALGGDLSGALNSFSVEMMTVGIGFAELSGTGVGGLEAKDLRTWAANSARVAGIGPMPLGRCSGVATVVVGGAGLVEGWIVGWAAGCGIILLGSARPCVGNGLCVGVGFCVGAAC